jgi:murein DD-endopeptidase MepM/ murein hydrolase activator NlpD
MGLLLGLIVGVGATWFLAFTDRGHAILAQVNSRINGGSASSASGSASSGAGAQVLGEVLAKLKNAAESAEEYAGKVSAGEKLESLAAELKDAARKGGAEAGALWIEARQNALAAAEKAPDIDGLGNSLGGWEKQLAAYEMAQHAADKNDQDAAASERKIDAVFSAPVQAASASSSSSSQAVASAPGGKPAPGGFQPLTPFYKCPVMQVSNSGPTGPDRTLTNYTPYVSTAAGVLIRAPITAACLSSGFGSRVEEGKTETHPGVDYYNRAGGPIYAAGDGVVTFAAEDPSYGFSVLIDHGSGVEGHYAHMVPGSLKVHKGDHVKQGELIGQMGHSGRAYAVHLHYELRFNGQLVDPFYVGRPATTGKKPRAKTADVLRKGTPVRMAAAS